MDCDNVALCEVVWAFCKKISNPRWHILNENTEPVTSYFTIKVKDKKHSDKAILYPVPVIEGPEVNSVKNKRKDTGADRCNDIFLWKMDNSDRLGIVMGDNTHSPKRAKAGFEDQLSDDASFKSHEENMKPGKLSFDENEN